MKTILLIDDTASYLNELRSALNLELLENEAQVLSWQPTRQDELLPVEHLEKVLDENDVAFVVTDHDLTSQGSLGISGVVVVSACQSRAIPVADFSRNPASRLPTKPNLFEIRLPGRADARSAKYIAGIFRGFEKIRTMLDQLESLPRSPSAGIAILLNRPNEQSRFSLYGMGYPSVNSGLLDRIEGKKTQEERDLEMRKLFAYLSGHVLLNHVLRFPGPILSLKALAAYCAVNLNTEVGTLRDAFAACRYDGPFQDCDEWFWTDMVDNTLASAAGDSISEKETIGGQNRTALESIINRQLDRSDCVRCGGENGGFLCPFTGKTVCLRPDCSSGSNGWIPAGARLSRIEKDFYEEWAPLLGM